MSYSFGQKIALMLVPTGVGASVGGYAGDASRIAQKIAKEMPLIVNPNVVNAAVFSGITDGMFYVEGWVLEQFVKGNICLQPSTNNKIGVIFDKAIPENILNVHLNTLNAIQTIYDIDVKSNHLLVDFDKMEIGFLTYSGIDDFYKVKLEKQEDKELFNKIIKDYFFQAEIKLEGEADRLLTFSKEGVYAFDSIAYIMVMSNGEMYAYLDDEEEFNELNSSVYYVGENTKFN